MTNISPFHVSFFYWRGEAQEAAQQEEETAATQGPADQEAEDQTADQREDATGQSCHHRSVRCFVLNEHQTSLPSVYRDFAHDFFVQQIRLRCFLCLSTNTMTL